MLIKLVFVTCARVTKVVYWVQISAPCIMCAGTKNESMLRKVMRPGE
jgi:hypothetical protein